MQLTILYHLNCAQNLSARACVLSKIAGGMPLMPPFDGVGGAAAGAPPPPPPPPPLLHPLVPVVLADMMVVAWVGAVMLACDMGVARVVALVDAMVSPGVGVL